MGVLVVGGHRRDDPGVIASHIPRVPPPRKRREGRIKGVNGGHGRPRGARPGVTDGLQLLHKFKGNEGAQLQIGEVDPRKGNTDRVHNAEQTGRSLVAERVG
jgi:hypothetical protein